MTDKIFVTAIAEDERMCDSCFETINRGEKYLLEVELVSDGIGDPFLCDIAMCETCRNIYNHFGGTNVEQRDIEACLIISHCEQCEKRSKCNTPSYEIFTCDVIRNRWKPKD